MRRKLYFFCGTHLLYFGDVYVSFLISTLIHTFSCITDLLCFSHLTYFFTKTYLVRQFLYKFFTYNPFLRWKSSLVSCSPFISKPFLPIQLFNYIYTIANFKTSSNTCWRVQVKLYFQTLKTKCAKYFCFKFKLLIRSKLSAGNFNILFRLVVRVASNWFIPNNILFLLKGGGGRRTTPWIFYKTQPLGLFRLAFILHKTKSLFRLLLNFTTFWKVQTKGSRLSEFSKKFCKDLRTHFFLHGEFSWFRFFLDS